MSDSRPIRVLYMEDDASLSRLLHLTLIVSNSGVSFLEDLDFRNTKTLGLRLVITLTKQLEGTIELDRSSGTTSRLHLRDHNTKRLIQWQMRRS